MSDEKCCTGCNIFFGGEIRHIKECVFYPESLTEIYDRKDEENAKLKEENARLREIDEKALYALMFTRGYIGEQIWSDIDSEYEIIKKALKRGE